MDTENWLIARKMSSRWKRTYREPSSRLKQSSVTTSSSFPRISEILPAIHLNYIQESVRLGVADCVGARSSLFHDLDVYFLHVNLLIELWRKLCLLQQFRVHCRRHLE